VRLVKSDASAAITVGTVSHLAPWSDDDRVAATRFLPPSGLQTITRRDIGFCKSRLVMFGSASQFGLGSTPVRTVPG
jgi:hypothetical protein